MPDTLEVIKEAIALGQYRRARKILRIVLDMTPTAELWYLASTICETPAQEMGCLKAALKLDRQHLKARERYVELKRTQNEAMMPPLMALVDDLPIAEFDPSPPPIPDIFAYKREQQARSRRRWNYLGCGGSILLSLSSAYFVLTVMGSPIPAQIRQFLSGDVPAVPEGEITFGRPTPKPGDSAVSQAPVDGTPAPAGAPTLENYAAEATAGGFIVQPQKTQSLASSQPVNDVLDPGFSHEYLMESRRGDELLVAVQFFSPTATNVAGNVAILDPDGYNAGGQCQRDSIMADGSGAAFICKVNKSGVWRLQLFGRSGESTGVYIVSFQRT